MNNNTFDLIQQEPNSIAYRRRHRCLSHVQTVDGVTYQVVSVLPMSDDSYRPETANTKLRYLISGDKK